MYLTQTNVIRNLTKDEYLQLRELCFFSNCLYNVALYNICQQYFQEKHNFSGKRINRGLYLTKEGKIINADVNGAANILRKSKQRLNLERLCRGCLDNPLRIRL